MRNNTWVEEVAPSQTNLVGTKWIFTIKYRPDGSFERFKARLVARGFSQKSGDDYTETFAPIVQMATFCAFLSVVLQKILSVGNLILKTLLPNQR